MLKKILYGVFIVVVWSAAIYVFISRNGFDNRDRRLCYRTGGQWMSSGAGDACSRLDEYSCRSNIKCSPKFNRDGEKEVFTGCEEAAFCVCLGEEKEYVVDEGCRFKNEITTP